MLPFPCSHPFSGVLSCVMAAGGMEGEPLARWSEESLSTGSVVFPSGLGGGSLTSTSLPAGEISPRSGSMEMLESWAGRGETGGWETGGRETGGEAGGKTGGRETGGRETGGSGGGGETGREEGREGAGEVGIEVEGEVGWGLFVKSGCEIFLCLAGGSGEVGATFRLPFFSAGVVVGGDVGEPARESRKLRRKKKRQKEMTRLPFSLRRERKPCLFLKAFGSF